MPTNRTIRIDEEVWAQLQQRARPLEDTPNSVLRRVFGLEARDANAEIVDTRISKLMYLVQEAFGQKVQLQPHETGFTVLDTKGKPMAHLRVENGKLRVAVKEEDLKRAGLHDLLRERESRFFGGASVRWYIPEDDDSAYKEVAEVLKTFMDALVASSQEEKMLGR